MGLKSGMQRNAAGVPAGRVTGARRPTWLVLQSVAGEAAIVLLWWAPFQSDGVQVDVDGVQEGWRAWDCKQTRSGQDLFMHGC